MHACTCSKERDGHSVLIMHVHQAQQGHTREHAALVVVFTRCSPASRCPPRDRHLDSRSRHTVLCTYACELINSIELLTCISAIDASPRSQARRRRVSSEAGCGIQSTNVQQGQSCFKLRQRQLSSASSAPYVCTESRSVECTSTCTDVAHTHTPAADQGLALVPLGLLGR